MNNQRIMIISDLIVQFLKNSWLFSFKDIVDIMQILHFILVENKKVDDN